MDIRIFKEYLIRTGLSYNIFVYIGYCALFFLFEWEWARILAMNVTLVVFMYIFFLHLNLSTVQTLRVMPVSKTKLYTTLWYSSVALTFVTFVIGVLLGFVLQQILFAVFKDIGIPYGELFANRVRYVVIMLWLCNECFIAGLKFSVFLKDRGRVLNKSDAGILLLIHLLLPYVLFSTWNSHFLIPVAAIGCAIIQTFDSYRNAPKLLDDFFMACKQQPECETVEQTVSKAKPVVSINWFTTWLSNPIWNVVLNSLIIFIYLSTLCILAGMFVLNDYVGAGLLFACIIFYLILIERASSYIVAMRVFGSLPLSRWGVFLSCIFLPAIALLPLAIWINLLMGNSIVVYFIAWGSWLLTNAIILRWNVRVGFVTGLSLLVFYQIIVFLYTYCAKDLPTYAQYISHSSWIYVWGILAISIVWTYWLLYYDSNPYKRKEASFLPK